jgi:ferredoxin/coenzyme F420-reducing hydrogenase delta subunit
LKHVRNAVRRLFIPAERALDAAFGSRSNPLNNLGTLGFFFYWIVAVSGLYLYIFFDTGIPEAFDSIEELTHDQWYLGGVLRSLHRYASDGLVLVMVIHIAREFSLDRYRGARWFTWVTGMPIVWLVFASGITGYWLVWDRLAQYVAVVTSEWLDWLPIFGEPIASNFVSNQALDGRFFTLVIFMHIAIPLFLLLVLWIHLQRLSRPQVNPPRALAVGTFLALLALSLVKPAVSQGIADLNTVAAVIRLDWFYLGLYPLIDVWSAGSVWGVVAVLSLMLVAIPFMPTMRRPAPAVVDLANCNGCTRCANDCPYNAISMEPRTDGQPFERQAVVNDSLCVACGICAGSCPTSSPFRPGASLVPGIDLPHLPMTEIRDQIVNAAGALTGENRIVAIGCDDGPDVRSLKSDRIAAVRLTCTAMLPPTFLDFILARKLADGVLVTGCGEGQCQCRFGPEWTNQRFEGARDPRLRARVPRERIARLWAAKSDRRALERAADAFTEQLARIETTSTPSPCSASSPLRGSGHG